MRRLRAWSSVAGSLAVLAALPGVAAAANLDLENGGRTADFDAAAAEVNTLTVTLSGGNYVFTDGAGITITPGAGCAAGVTPNIATCPAVGVTEINANLGDLNDGAGAGASLPAALSRVVLVGGPGDDLLAGAPAVENSLTGDGGAPAGNDTLAGGNEDDQFSDGLGNDLMAGGAGNDSFTLSGGDDTADGGAGFDNFFSQSIAPDGRDTLIGGSEIDQVNFFPRRDNLTIDLDSVADDGAGCPGPGCEGDDFRSDVEGITTGTGDDFVTGSPANNDISTSVGNDTVRGGGGYDDISGSNGDDVLRGGAGPDEVSGGAGADLVFGGAGDDYTFADFFDIDTDVVSGGGGIDSIGGGGSNNIPVRIDLDNKADDGLVSPILSVAKDNVRSDVENLEGTTGPDVLIGSKKSNELEGGLGDDRLIGMGGGDHLAGDRGADTLLPGPGRDTVEGDAGADTVKSRDKTPDQISCGSSFDRVKADRGDDAGADCDQVRRR